MVLVHEIASNIIDSHPVTIKILFRNKTILRLSHIFTMPLSNYLKANRSIKKRHKMVKDSLRASVKVISPVNIQQIYFEAYIFFNTIDDKQ